MRGSRAISVCRAAIDQIDHRAGIAGELHLVFSVKLFRRRIDVRREDVLRRRFLRGLRTRERDVRRFGYFTIRFVLDLL